MTDVDTPDLADAITPNEAARILKASLRQVYRWIDEGKLPAVKVVGRLYVQRADALGLVQPVVPRGRPGKEPKRSRQEQRAVEKWRQGVRKRSRI